jgi:hypothetical protein
VAFRLAFCYFITYCLCVGNATLWQAIPFIGDIVNGNLAQPFRLLAQYLAQNWIHIQGVGAKFHGGGSGDTAIDWLVVAEMLTLALAATLVWTILDRRRPHYQTLAAWLRFTIRLTLGMGMVNYGLAKLFPLQMAPPLMGVLNEPLGNTSPMTMLWTLIGLNPVYEMICGGAELLAGVLILFRRTALLGALLTAFLTTNIVLYNFCFDVPVKLYASHLLLLSLFVILPDSKSLFRFFWQHQPAVPLGIWVPPARRPSFRRATAIIEIAFFVLCIGNTTYTIGSRWLQVVEARNIHTPLIGAWRLDTATLHGKPEPLLVGVDQPATVIYIETPLRGNIRSTNGQLWRTQIKDDEAKHTLEIHPTASKGGTYNFTLPDPNHLTLTPTGPNQDKTATLTLTRIPLPAQYPLLTRGFHFISEWGVER